MRPKIERWFLAAVAESIAVVAESIAVAATQFAERRMMGGDQPAETACWYLTA